MRTADIWESPLNVVRSSRRSSFEEISVRGHRAFSLTAPYVPGSQLLIEINEERTLAIVSNESTTARQFAESFDFSQLAVDGLAPPVGISGYFQKGDQYPREKMAWGDLRSEVIVEWMRPHEVSGSYLEFPVVQFERIDRFVRLVTRKDEYLVVVTTRTEDEEFLRQVAGRFTPEAPNETAVDDLQCRGRRRTWPTGIGSVQFGVPLGRVDGDFLSISTREIVDPVWWTEDWVEGELADGRRCFRSEPSWTRFEWRDKHVTISTENLSDDEVVFVADQLMEIRAETI
jgi:hypothetical protein